MCSVGAEVVPEDYACVAVVGYCFEACNQHAGDCSLSMASGRGSDWRRHPSAAAIQTFDWLPIQVVEESEISDTGRFGKVHELLSLRLILRGPQVTLIIVR